MRYVVRKNFFGLENKPRKGKEHINGTNGKQSDEEKFISHALVYGEKISAEKSCDKDSGHVNTTDVKQCSLQNCNTESTQALVNDENCSGQSSNGGTVQNSAETSSKIGAECTQNTDETATRENKPTYLIYDDEIWESHLK